MDKSIIKEAKKCWIYRRPFCLLYIHLYWAVLIGLVKQSIYQPIAIPRLPK